MVSGIEIGSLPTTASAQLADVVPANQMGVTIQESLLQILTLFLANLNSGVGLTDGQVLIGSTGNPPVGAVLTPGANITISNGAGSITIAASGLPGIGWVNVTGASATMVPDTGYLADNAGTVSLTLPTAAAFGTIIYVQGFAAGGWSILQNAGQSVIVGSVKSVVGVTGSVASTNRYDAITLVCVTANTVWAAMSVIGNLSVVTA